MNCLNNFKTNSQKLKSKRLTTKKESHKALNFYKKPTLE
jgi:hypothetical protein